MIPLSSTRSLVAVPTELPRVIITGKHELSQETYMQFLELTNVLDLNRCSSFLT
jgi:hypothetical protein